MKKSAKALLGAGAIFFGSGLAMNTFVLTRVSKKVSEFKKEMEEKTFKLIEAVAENLAEQVLLYDPRTQARSQRILDRILILEALSNCRHCTTLTH